MGEMAVRIPELEMSIKTFINADGSVDGELRIANLLDAWREAGGQVALAIFLSNVFRAVGTLSAGGEGGRYYISIGCRFGPQNDAEVEELAKLYKRFRGLFQIAAYHTAADVMMAIQNNVIAIEDMMKSLMDKRGVPASVIFVRLTWTPDGVKPDRYEGERGGGN